MQIQSRRAACWPSCQVLAVKFVATPRICLNQLPMHYCISSVQLARRPWLGL